MSTDAQQDSGAITRIDRRSSASESSASESTGPDICQGCRELTDRVERLERALASREENVSSEQIGTTACYWSCVGVHALLAFVLFASEQMVQLGLMLCLGGLATLVVCQVFSTRPVHLRALRTLLSACVVAVAAMLGLWAGDVADPSDIAPFLVVYFPPIFAGGWLVAKLFVWTGGWRIVPPGSPSLHPRLQIRHLLLCTLFFAAYLAAGQLVEFNIEDWIEGGILATLLYLGIPLAVCVSVSCVLAKILLTVPSNNAVLHAVLLAIFTTTFITLICAGIMPLLTNFEMDWQASVGLFVYMAPMGIGVFLSSGGTFAMMRLARYRFASG